MAKKPQYMITYLCNKCGQDFARTELDKPICFYCQTKGDCQIIKKQTITPEVIAERMEITSQRMMENLKKAYQTRPNDVDEQKLLEVMAKAKELNKKTDQIWKEKLEEDNKK